MKESFVFGVLGHHIGYSRSPEIFKAIAEINGFSHSFVLHDIAPSDFPDAFPRVLSSGINGFSVTIPHKSRVMSYLDEVEPIAEQIGAVNSVCVKNGRAHGFSTDGNGFKIPLLKHQPDLKNGCAIILGAGGAARAVIHCLATVFEITLFYVAGRNSDKLKQFCGDMSAALPEAELRAVMLSGLNGLMDIDYNMIVNCTPLGGWNYTDQSPFPEDFPFRRGKIYYDINYNDDNKAVEKARREHMLAYDGSTMLIGQAVRSFELWTGQTVDFEPVYRAVFQNR